MPTANINNSTSTNQFSVAFAPQTDYGVINSPLVFDVFNRSGGRVTANKPKTRTNNINPTRQGKQLVDDLGEIEFELQADITEQVIQLVDAAVLGVPVDNSFANIGTITANATGDTFTSSDPNEFAGLEVGDWFKVTDLSAENGIYRVKTKVSDDEIFINRIINTTGIVAAPGVATFSSIKTVSASEQQMFILQNREPNDSAPDDGTTYKTYYNSLIDSTTLAFESTANATITQNYKASGEINGISKVAGQTDNPLDDSQVVSNINNVYAVIDGVDAACQVNNVSFEISNNHTSDGGAVGCDTQNYIPGNISISISMEMKSPRLDSFDPQGWFEDSDRKAIAIVIFWGNGRFLVVDVPQAVVTEHDKPSGADEVAVHTMTLEHEPDDINGQAIRFFRN